MSDTAFAIIGGVFCAVVYLAALLVGVLFIKIRTDLREQRDVDARARMRSTDDFDPTFDPSRFQKMRRPGR